MIDRTHYLPVARQCRVLSLARSTAYYRPQEASEAEVFGCETLAVFARILTLKGCVKSKHYQLE